MADPTDWDAALAADRERFRAGLADSGAAGIAVLRSFDAAMRDVDSGVFGARNCWHSLSPARRRVCLFLAHGHSIRMPEGRVLVRSARVAGYYDAAGSAPGLDTIARAARLDTVRALARHGLVAWGGGTTDPEARAVASERLRFVVAHRGDAP